MIDERQDAWGGSAGEVLGSLSGGLRALLGSAWRWDGRRAIMRSQDTLVHRQITDAESG